MSGAARPRPIIAVQRLTTLLTDDQMRNFIVAQQIQLDRDVFPAWGISADLRFAPAGSLIDPSWWTLLLLNDSDQADALGYHAVSPTGVPVMKAFIASDIAEGVPWTITPSHETIEGLIDPDCTQTEVIQRGAVTYEYPLEACDACEDDRFAYPIVVNGVPHMMSDFVLRAWFNPASAPGTKFTFRDSVHEALGLAPGGYTGQREAAPVPGEWTQLMAQGAPGRRAINKSAHSRTVRRGIIRLAA